MLQSKLFTKTRKEAPKDEVSKNADLLIRAGYIHKEMAGVYSYLPLGLRTLNKIINIIREEMNAIDGQEISMTALQEKALWEKTNRWSDEVVDVWFKTKLKNDTELGLGTTHEEPITRLMKDFVSSYRDLPFLAYQFQTKFRNEVRAKSGIMRAREFIMKDLYTFSKDKEQHEVVYEKAKQAYVKIFKRLGLGDITYVTFASGGIFSKFSEEFQTVSEAGEDLIYIDEKTGRAFNKEVLLPEILAEFGLKKEDLVEKKSIEVGNIFTLGTRFSDALELFYLDDKGEKQSVFMGSYGIGPGRSMGAIVEALGDEKGIVWPKEVAPFSLHLIALNTEDASVKAYADELYRKLNDAGVEVLYDDRDLRAGEKFADSDLIGIPMRAVVSKKTLESKMIELKERKSGEVKMISEAEFLKM